MVQEGNFNHLLRFKRLTCQLMVDVYEKIEAERLFYFRRNQARLRAEQYVHLRDALINNIHLQNIGQPVVLPSSFIVGPSFMTERTQDAMTYVRKFGRPIYSSPSNATQSGWRLKENWKGQTQQQDFDMTSYPMFLKGNKTNSCGC